MESSTPSYTDKLPHFTGSYGKLILQKLHKEKDHLGNVLATVSDRKVGEDADSDGKVDYYRADVMSTQSYYPFGMPMSGKGYNIGGTKFGFNDKLSDGEVYGTKNFYDYGKRMYDPRLARFPSVDPLNSKFPGLSAYQYASNSPIVLIDKDGKQGEEPDKKQDEPFISKGDILTILEQSAEVVKEYGKGTVKTTAKYFTWFVGGVIDLYNYAEKDEMPGVPAPLDKQFEKWEKSQQDIQSDLIIKNFKKGNIDFSKFKEMASSHNKRIKSSSTSEIRMAYLTSEQYKTFKKTGMLNIENLNKKQITTRKLTREEIKNRANLDNKLTHVVIYTSGQEKYSKSGSVIPKAEKEFTEGKTK